ncbi:hypothetical protein [Citrobacter europaeus]|uniref:hypothetical protein n=1 Tax=Citrobacter europaeus TaxID=1914243 RepID=UPI0018FFFF56|nr:hypothetical protein [Citrobacter europaeus]MBJ8823574.1 hypothetical protein [Citrobacter freundii]MDT7086262.1 hypothetical protein [Citrobacter europaeus]
MTTNNHPAHAPLTSRRLHQMRDILSKAAAQRGGGDIGYAMSDAVKLIDEVLASEPVVQIEVLSGILVNERWMHQSLPDGWHDLFASRAG